MMKQTKKFLSNRSGFTLPEIMAALATFSIVVAAQTTVWLGAKRALNRVESVGQKDVMRNRFIQDVHAQVNGYQINFLSTVDAEQDLENDKLPMAWNTNDVFVKEDCEFCLGRSGYIVQPFALPTDQETYRGMYRMVLRIYHKELFPNGATQEFLFTSK